MDSARYRISIRRTTGLVLVLGLAFALSAGAQENGSIRGVVFDRDFEQPIPGASVTLVETGQKVDGSEQGNYLLTDIAPGTYTLVVAKEGYVRYFKPGFEVRAGQQRDLDVYLSGEFVELEEFIVQDSLQLAGGSEAALLELRFDSPALLDSVGADLISRAGASDAGDALRLVAGASVADGKSAVIRGLPDRFVSTQLNQVRLPSSDDQKRVVRLDQFPSAVIESVQVSKTFTPDQQGDASGGGVNIKTKGIPSDPLFFRLKSQVGFNSQVTGRDDFLSYKGGGLRLLGEDGGGRDQQLENLGANWTGAAGVSETEAPIDHKWSLSAGGNHDLDRDLKIGGMVNAFYERDSSYDDSGVDNSLWVESPGAPLTPQASQGSVQDGDFRTSLLDITRASQSVQLGLLASVGIEAENHKLGATYFFSRTAEDEATLAEDTRAKEFFFPGFDPNDPTSPGHSDPDAAPYLRLETLEYTERSTASLQIRGDHRFEFASFDLGNAFKFKAPELDWTLAFSSAELDQPDKRQFGAAWFPGREPFPGLVIAAQHRSFKPAANFNLGNLQRIYKTIEEESDQISVNLRLPFEQWSGLDGYLKFGLFRDKVDRSFDQDSFSNFGDASAAFDGDFDQFWSAVFPSENHPITESLLDVDYEGLQKISAQYLMLDLPLLPELKVVGGVRFESTKLGIVNDPEADATWFPAGSLAQTRLNPGDADVNFEQEDLLPYIGLEWRPIDDFIVRAAYNETVARQTFREITPILQQEFSGGDIFIGNPELQMASVTNYDLRLDWTPYSGGLLSASFFHKDLENPIEFVQRIASAFNFTTPVNYPEGQLTGFEFEVRQDLGHFHDMFEGLSIGANATLIDAEVTLPDDEVAAFNSPSVLVPTTRRDMTNTPESLLNLYLTYDLAKFGTQLGLFYTAQGDTLVAGAGVADGNFVPSIYQTGFGTLNFSFSQKLGEHFKLEFKAKNLTNPKLRRVYRAAVAGGDTTETSTRRGVDLSLSLGAEFRF